MPPRPLARITIKDLARDLGMSVATVARAFHSGGTIAEGTRQAVLKRAAELGYQPNALARGMITRHTRIVGVVLSDLENPFYPQVLTRLTEALQQVGLNVMLVVAEPSGSVDSAMRLLLSYQPEYAVILATTLTTGAAAACRAAGTPLLFFNRAPAEEEACAVVCDNAAGAAAVADHLVACGARRLAFLGGRPDTSTHAERRAGFLERCAAHGLPAPLEAPAGAFTYAAGYAAAQRLLAAPERPEALFCANDILAIGAMQAARREFGLRIPRDLAIAGFDDVAMASWPEHDLTTLRQPIPAMVELAVRWVCRSAAGEAPPQGTLRLPGTLVVRGTTRPGTPSLPAPALEDQA
ncbi:LacI family DNA-binding transcriptional regulator [Roseomonas sp. M0104]|uniref:LacI family DNA-binding transcriptional regulator n=1 Tax=Teichococcus coralli TaxID=2545983 RepID=A0A845B761_9PROT|nr:LacI family DNA-binding transcriptional regulator [Pseudoroseomonas coralli]MXP62318.1 LacI family DNA-binding transcriptional regulator [Pseudoroseomonas coralli]